jgi:hypothetical protein
MSYLLRVALIQLLVLEASLRAAPAIKSIALYQRPSQAVGGDQRSSLGQGCGIVDVPDDHFCAEVLQRSGTIANSSQPDRDLQLRSDAHQQNFKLKFDQLVEALQNFATQYNAGKGAVWPQREGNRLREAIRQFQSLEKFLRDEPKPRPRLQKSILVEQ